MTGARFWSFHLIEEALQYAPESTRLALLTSVESILANPLEPEGLRVIRARGRAALSSPVLMRLIGRLEGGWRITYDVTPPEPPLGLHMVRVVSVLKAIDAGRD